MGVTPEVNNDVQNSTDSYVTAPKEYRLQTTNPSLAKKLFPSGFRKEFRKLFSLAWPVYLSALSNTVLGPVSLIFCGHLGRAQLDGVALAISVLNITGVSICSGLSTACDTLFSQAFGGEHRRLVGIIFQRSLIIISLACFVCWSIHLNAEGLLVALGQNPDVAKISADYLLFFMPGLMFNFVYQVLTKFLQNQNYVIGPVVIGAIGNGFNVLAQYVAIYVLDFGIRGSAVAQALSYLCMCLGTLMYIIGSGMYKQTWSGWSWKALENWGMFLKLAIPGLVMMSIELWSFEIGIFLNGILGDVELGATSITFQLESILYMIPLGISLSCSIRVGQNVGAGNADGAKTAARVAQTFAWIVFVFLAIILLSCRNVLPYIFTSDKEIVSLVSTALPILVYIQFLDSITAPSMGTLRGCGRQLMGAICNFLGYCVFTVPLAAILMFVVKAGMMGFWYGLSMVITPVCVVYLIMISRINWKKEVTLAADRSSEITERGSTSEESPLLSDSPSDKSRRAVMSDPAVSNYAFLSQSLEIAMTESVDTSLTQAEKIRLACRRLLALTCILGVFLVGLMTRLFIPVSQHNGHINTTVTIGPPFITEQITMFSK